MEPDPSGSIKYITPTPIKREEDPIEKTFGPAFEVKFDEIKSAISAKMDKELADSQNVRDYITQKYDDICKKIGFLSELDAKVTAFRSDIKSIESHVRELENRVDDVEKRLICLPKSEQEKFDIETCKSLIKDVKSRHEQFVEENLVGSMQLNSPPLLPV